MHSARTISGVLILMALLTPSATGQVKNGKDDELERMVRKIMNATRTYAEKRRRAATDVPLDEKSSIPALVDGLTYSKATRLQAAELLRALEGDALPAMPALAKALEDTNDLELQLAYVDAMLVIAPTDPSSIPAHRFLLSNGDETQRAAAAMALGSFSSYGKSLYRPLIWASRDDSLQVAREAVTALGMLGAGAKQALPVLKRHTEHEDKQLSRRAEAAIQSIERAIEKAKKPASRPTGGR